MTSARMKPRSKSVWITPAACGAVDARAHGPGAHFLRTRGEIGLQSQQFVGGADDAIKSGLLKPQLAQELGAVRLLQLRDLRFDGGADRYRLACLRRAREPRMAAS